MSREIAFIETKNNISVLVNSRWRSFNLATAQGKNLLAALREDPQDFEKICMLSDVPTFITLHTFGRVTVDDRDQIRLDGEVVDYGVADMILRLVKEGQPVKYLTRFLENVASNPDKNVAPHLYDFLQKGGMPITPDGYILAFKTVSADYKSGRSGNEDITIYAPESETDDYAGSRHSHVERGRITHKVGTLLVMNREDCDPDRDRTCSVGLHACSFEYLPKYDGGTAHTMIVKINPRDVTAIPSDHDDSKLRCCQLEVVDEIPRADAKEHFQSIVDRRYSTDPAPLAPEDEAAMEEHIDAALAVDRVDVGEGEEADDKLGEAPVVQHITKLVPEAGADMIGFVMNSDCQQIGIIESLEFVSTTDVLQGQDLINGAAMMVLDPTDEQRASFTDGPNVVLLGDQVVGTVTDTNIKVEQIKPQWLNAQGTLKGGSMLIVVAVQTAQGGEAAVADTADEPEMTLAEAVDHGITDGTNEAFDDDQFDGDPESGEHYFTTPEQFDLAYISAYAGAYALAYKLPVFFSKEAFDLGGKDGVAQAAQDFEAEIFAAAFTEGPGYEDADNSEQGDAYAKGYVLAYCEYFKVRLHRASLAAGLHDDAGA